MDDKSLIPVVSGGKTLVTGYELIWKVSSKHRLFSCFRRNCPKSRSDWGKAAPTPTQAPRPHLINRHCTNRADPKSQRFRPQQCSNTGQKINGRRQQQASLIKATSYSNFIYDSNLNVGFMPYMTEKQRKKPSLHL